MQEWLNQQKDTLKWVWKTIGGHLRPITTTHPTAPEDLLSLIVCTCKDECVQNCECRRSGLNCSNMCSNGPYAPFGFESIEKQLWRNKQNDRPISDSEIKAVLSQQFKTDQWLPLASHVSEDVTSHA
ncbi:hypothetical protein AVEN_34184-1 [Araneus ventricosus]|uniref:Uncharacterized protein n=1 Tax=Araneus ventricosus TaxID=182803 RepID=A0A4Y2NBU4_ARAVE|nr:hypothetical protein AVEN_34184-1 [Araneus ventricosus]